MLAHMSSFQWYRSLYAQHPLFLRKLASKWQFEHQIRPMRLKTAVGGPELGLKTAVGGPDLIWKLLSAVQIWSENCCRRSRTWSENCCRRSVDCRQQFSDQKHIQVITAGQDSFISKNYTRNMLMVRIAVFSSVLFLQGYIFSPANWILSRKYFWIFEF